MKKVKTIVCLLLAAVLVLPLAACNKNRRAPASEVDPEDFTWLNQLTADSSDLASWSKGELELSVWNANQTGMFKTYKSPEDKVSPEIKRLTGVSISDETDNRGVSAMTRFAQLYETDSLPDIAYATYEMSDIIAADDKGNREVYDLTKYVEQYCPTIMRRMPEAVWENPVVNGGEPGKVYAIPYGNGNVSLSEVDTSIAEEDKSKVVSFEYLNEYYGFIYVREDILKDAYPTAHTNVELQEIFETNGGFTHDELFDVPIKSTDDFYTFMDTICNTINNPANKTKYQMPNARMVQTILAADGRDRDNWSLMGVLFPRIMGASGPLNTMFTYWDVEEQKVQMMLTKDFFKDMLKDWVDMMATGKYCDNYGTTQLYSTIQAELNQGYYAITYPNAIASGDYAVVPAVGSRPEQEIKYRKVWLEIEKDERFEFFAQEVPQPSSVCIFKDAIDEEYIPQILMWLDFQQSEAADKLYSWGPRNGGLWEEKDGVRQFKDQDLVTQMVYERGVLGDKVIKYNLSNAMTESPQTTFPFFYCGGSKDHPVTCYDLSKDPDYINIFFNPAVAEPKEAVAIARRADMHTWTDTDLKGIQNLWGKRASIEAELRAVLTSKVGGGSDGKFESSWNNLQQALRTAGWTNEYFGGKYTQKFLELNKDYVNGFYKGAAA